MAIPDFQTLMLPVLKAFADGKDRTPAEVRAPIAAEFHLSEGELATLLPSGRQSSFTNRVAWALSYLKQAGILQSPLRGHYQITDRGKQILFSPPTRVDIAYLEQYPDFQAFRKRGAVSVDPALEKILTEGIPASIDGATLTPDEQVRVGAARFKEILAAQLLERVKQASPGLLEIRANRIPEASEEVS
jgi:restriction system protein